MPGGIRTSTPPLASARLVGAAVAVVVLAALASAEPVALPAAALALLA
jgi:hypothetical protein